MLSVFVLALNFIALAGICLGLLLQSTAVRSALLRTSIRADVVSAGIVPSHQLKPLTDAVLSALLLRSGDRISMKKIAGLSFLSCVLFLSSMGAPFSFFSGTEAPIAALFGGGMLGAATATLVLYLVVWPSHFMYDLVSTHVLLWVWRRIESKSLVRKVIFIASAVVALSVVPLLLAYTVFHWKYGFSVPVQLSYETGELLLIAPFMLNAPVLMWMFVALAAFSTSATVPFKFAQWMLLLLSCAMSGAVLTAVAIARTAGSSRRVSRLVARATHALTETDASRLFQYSLTAFTIGNGLCQIFSISIPLAPSPKG